MTLAPLVVTDDGEVPFLAPVRGVTPTDAAHLATKAYADSLGGGVSDGDKGDIVVTGGVWGLDPSVVTAAGRALVDDADAAAQRTTLGLGTAATQASGAFEAAGSVAAHDGDGSAHAGILVAVGDAATSLAMSTARLLGRTTGGAGGVEEITIGSGLGMAAGVLEATGGGSDPWTTVILGSDFTISTTSNNTVTGLNFTPSASTTYLVEMFLLVRTATATVGARPGISWPTGLTDAASQITVPNSNTALATRAQGAISTTNAASTGLPTTTHSYLAMGTALLIVGGSPSGNFQITLASETGGTNVTMRAGSFLMYREIA